MTIRPPLFFNKTNITHMTTYVSRRSTIICIMLKNVALYIGSCSDSWCLAPFTTIFQLYRGCQLVEETGVPGEDHQPVASHRYTSLHNVVLSTPNHEQHAAL